MTGGSSEAEGAPLSARDNKPDLAGVLLAFDFGFRRIGVATGQALTGTANPLTVVESRAGGIDWEALDRLVREWRPSALVVGLPVHADGAEHEITRAARQFGRELEERTGLPVHFADERYTSRLAASDFAAMRREGAARRKDRRMLDAVAAQRILETFLNER